MKNNCSVFVHIQCGQAYYVLGCNQENTETNGSESSWIWSIGVWCSG